MKKSTKCILKGIGCETVAVGAFVGKIAWHLVTGTRPHNGYSAQKTLDTCEKWDEKGGEFFSEADRLRNKGL